MTTALSFGGVTITEYYHIAEDSPASPEIENIAYPGAAGRVTRLVGSQQSPESSRTIRFAEEQFKPNRIVGASVAAVSTIQTSVETFWLSNATGTLVTYEDTSGITNMQLIDFATSGEIRKAGNAPVAIAYYLPFQATFAKVNA